MIEIRFYRPRNEIYNEGIQQKQETPDNHAQENDVQLMTDGNTPHTLKTMYM
jgi:hypothetical protein